MLLRHYLKQGFTKTALAEKLDISRRTVYHWIQSGQLDRDLDQEAARYKPRPAVPRKIDPFKRIIQTRLGDYPELRTVTVTMIFSPFILMAAVAYGWIAADIWHKKKTEK